jgi:general stress protein 26
MSQKLKAKILEVMKKYPVGSVATIKDGKPWVRYMMTQPEDDLTIYTTSFVSSRKIDQIKADNNVHITYGFDPANWEQPYVQVVGTAEILTDLETKKKCWHDVLAKFFKGPEDPGFVVLKITPSLIEYMGSGAFEPETLEL